MIPADSQQAGLFAVVVIIVALKAWHGWRLGVVRQAVGLIALVAAVCAAFFAGPFVAPLLVDVPQIPETARVQVGGLGLAVLLYLAITLSSAIVFKKTEHQSVGMIRFGYGMAGAVLGAVTGLVLAAFLLGAFLVATGGPEIADQLRRGEYEKALDSARAKLDNAPAKTHRAAPR